MITKEKLKIFDSYEGDVDQFARVGSGSEKKLFDANDWSLIENLYQDIALINKRLAAQIFIDKTFVNLRENFDRDSYDYFISKIECYKNFQKIAGILRQIKSFIKPDTDTVWSRFDNA